MTPRILSPRSPVPQCARLLTATLAFVLSGSVLAETKVRSFVLSNIYIAMASEPNTCKQLSDGAIDIFKRTLPPAEQAQYASDGKRAELGDLMAQRLKFVMEAIGSENGSQPTPQQLDELRKQHGVPAGKGTMVFNGTRFAYDSCTNPEDFSLFNTGNQRYIGKIAYGANLDGKNSSGDFISPNGGKGIDNKLIRATGCAFNARDYGDPENAEKAIVSGDAPTLVEVTGIDNEQNDPDVAVAVYSSATPLTLNALGAPMASVSFDINRDPRYTSHVRGRIVNGELITDTFDLRVRMKEQIVNSYRELRNARLRATWKPDGSIHGELVGYHTIASIKDQYVQSTQIGANLTRMSCPALLSAIEREADGFPDPQTGRNTAISSALRFVGVSAFVIHSEPQTAQNAPY
jgi:hypothetical protein